MDNDDFKDDTLTGANTSHRINVMFVQSSNVKNTEDKIGNIKLVKPSEIQNLVDEHIRITPYKSVKKGVLPIREEIDTSPPTTELIRKDEIVHTLIHMNQEYKNIEPINQNIGSFAGFQALINGPVIQSKPYYFLTFLKPPYKTVVHEVMTRMIKVIEG